MNYGFPVLALFVFAYALVSKRLATAPIAGPMLFVAFGVVTGSHVLGWIDPAAEWEGVRLLLEITLVGVLFTDALAINTSRWREDAAIPARLLGIGLPLTMLIGCGLAAVLAPELGVWEAALVGVLLAPTDPALGQAVVSNLRVPERIRVALNVESGLNDGLALPVFFVVLELAQASEGALRPAGVIGEIIVEVGLAAAIGVGIGVIGARALGGATSRGLTDRPWTQVALGALALAAWALANAAGGSGFIAAWVAGAAFGHVARDALPAIHEFVEESSHLLALLSLYVFGAVGASLLIDTTWSAVVYAILSLTVVRMLPVAVSLAGSGLGRPTVLYLGWFGPRGLASIILTLIVVQDIDLAATPTIVLFTVATVTLSVLAHGLTAVWGSNAYGDWCETGIEQLASVLGTDLPPDFGQLVIMSEARLEELQAAMRTFDRLPWFLLVITLALIAGAIASSLRRLRTVASVAIGTAFGMLIAIVGLRRIEQVVLDAVADPEGRAATRAVLTAVLGSLRTTLVVLMIIGVLLGIVIILSERGSLQAAWRWLEATMRPALGGSAAERFTAHYADPLRAGGLAAAAVALFFAGIGWPQVIIIGGLLGLYWWWIAASAARIAPESREGPVDANVSG